MIDWDINEPISKNGHVNNKQEGFHIVLIKDNGMLYPKSAF